MLLEAAAPAIAVYSESDLADLPPPVARYFRKVLTDRQPIVRHARVRWSGTFNMGKPGRDQWVAFSAIQDFVPTTHAFVWDARMQMLPGVPVMVRDELVGGQGSMLGAIMGLITVVDVRGTTNISTNALLRFLGEAVWVPTALLPSQGVRWTAIDDATARAAISNGTSTVQAEFHFGADGLIESMTSSERTFDDGTNPPAIQPWGGTYRRYERRGTMLVPLDSEAAWSLPTGRFVYWRGTPEAIEYR